MKEIFTIQNNTGSKIEIVPYYYKERLLIEAISDPLMVKGLPEYTLYDIKLNQIIKKTNILSKTQIDGEGNVLADIPVDKNGNYVSKLSQDTKKMMVKLGNINLVAKCKNPF